MTLTSNHVRMRYRINLEVTNMDAEKVFVEPESVEVVETALSKETQGSPMLEQTRYSFEKLMEMSMVLAKSTMLPSNYYNKPENVFIALDIASRTGMSPLVVAQNLHVIQGRPSWSGQAIASMIKSSTQFSEVELVYVGEEGKDTWGAYVQAKNRRSGKLIKGGTVTMSTAKAEGWYQKNGSKWKTMPELMLAYRAYAWFGRVYSPELLMGLQTVEEVVDVHGNELEVSDEPLNPFEKKV